MVHISEKKFAQKNLLKHIRKTDSHYNDSVTYEAVKIKFSESKADVEVEESINHNARFGAWRLVGSSVSASNIDNCRIVLILPTPIP